MAQYMIVCYTSVYYSLLYYNMLCYAVLYYIMLDYTILCYNIIYFAILCCTASHCTILWYAILSCIIPCYTIIHHCSRTFLLGTSGPPWLIWVALVPLSSSECIWGYSKPVCHVWAKPLRKQSNKKSKHGLQTYSKTIEKSKKQIKIRRSMASGWWVGRPGHPPGHRSANLWFFWFFFVFSMVLLWVCSPCFDFFGFF